MVMCVAAATGAATATTAATACKQIELCL